MLAVGAPVSAQVLCHHDGMQIESPCVVTLTWALSDAQGQPLDALEEPVAFFYGGDDLLPRVEEALAGQGEGLEITVHLEPEHAFGDYDSTLVCFEDRKLFPAALEAGMQFDGLPQGCVTPNMPGDRIYVVTEVYPEHVVLDGNHPLAGMALRMALKVHEVRDATMSEVEAGSVSGAAVSVLESAPPAPGLH
jgi:FKBP-type peptidyl-prolyl cis-trans isomerase SlyD